MSETSLAPEMVEHKNGDSTTSMTTIETDLDGLGIVFTGQAPGIRTSRLIFGDVIAAMSIFPMEAGYKCN